MRIAPHESGVHLELLNKAGVLLWPILACSVVGLAVLVHRIAYFRAARKRNKVILKRILPLVEAGNIDDAARNCEDARGPVARVLGTLFASQRFPEAARKELIEIAAEREVREIEWGLRPLGVIARVAPLLGLLGTVLGLVEAFVAFSTGHGQPNPALLADGIWQALLTTVAGLIVAIPAIFAHEWCESQADSQVFKIREALTQVQSREGT
jgi:biopolymer transport protein ExbB